jgi:hypothetical protein
LSKNAEGEPLTHPKSGFEHTVCFSGVQVSLTAKLSAMTPSAQKLEDHLTPPHQG